MRYTGFRDRPMDERQLRFQAECREGHADVVSNCGDHLDADVKTRINKKFCKSHWIKLGTIITARKSQGTPKVIS